MEYKYNCYRCGEEVILTNEQVKRAISLGESAMGKPIPKERECVFCDICQPLIIKWWNSLSDEERNIRAESDKSKRIYEQ